MKKKILRLRKLLSLVKRQKIPALAYLQNIVIWTILIPSLLASCSQGEKPQSLIFEEQGEQIAVSTEDYAMIFVEDEVAVELPTGQSVAAMNVETSTPILEGNKVIYEDIADQTDLIFYDKGTGHVGYDIHLAPHTKVEDIKIPLPNSANAFISRGGDLIIPTTEGYIKHSKPIAYQEIDRERKEVESKFRLEDEILSFEVESYEEDYSLIIDPEITYETALVIDGSTVTITSGSPIITGTTATVNFQVTNNAAPNQEYIYRVLLSLPSGWTAACNTNDATDSGGAATNFTCINGSTGGSPTANAVQYTGESPSFGEITGGNTWNFSITATVPNGTAAGDYNFTYTLTGDGFGNPGSTPDIESGNGIISVANNVDPNTVCVNVFRDYNSNGTDDGDGEPAISSVTVTAYDASNNATVLTNNNDGTYTFMPGNADTYRIEVTGLSGNLEPSVAGATTTFFMSRGNKAEVGLNEPAEYYPSSGVFLATPCYVEGGTNGSNASQDVMVIVAESSLTGGAGNLTPTEYFVADHSQIGATFGISHSRAANSIFAAAFAKRHTAFGPGGTGAIYKIDLNGDTPTTPISSTGVSTFIDLNALFGANTAGANTHPNGSDFDRDTDTYDAVGKIGLGGLALSETENVLWTINLADRKLYEIPLGGTRENPTAPATSAGISVWPTSGDLTGLPGLTGTASDIRPFAVKCHKGEIYIGMVNTAESTVVFDAGTNTITNTGDRSAMRGFIYKFNPDTDTFTKLLEFPLDYARGQAIDFCTNNAQAEFYPWSPIFDADVMLTAVMGTTVSDPMSNLIGERAYPQAWITDIEFDEEGKMLIGIRDRFADQHGYDNPPPSVLETALNFTADGAGDILIASINTTDNTTYILESNSANGTNGAAFGPTTGINKGEGPGGGEFFFDDRYRPANASSDGDAASSDCPANSSDPTDQDPILDPQFEQGHDEICTGGIFHYNGKIAVYFSAYDPINDFNNFNNAGLVSLSTSDGSRQGANQIYATTTTNNFTFAKGNGLGDVAGVSGAAPIQVGNRLWLDANSNGRQDPNEDGINGVLVELFKETAPSTFTKVAETTTMADAVQGNGFFIFSDNSDVNQTWVSGTEVLAEMNYEIRVSLAAVQAQDGTVQAFASANTGGITDNNNKTDLSDSDADASGVIAFTTGIEGQNNHTLDIGAVFMPICVLTINSSTPDMTCTGGTYDVDFALTWTEAPTTGNFEVSVDGGMNFTTVTRTDFGANSSETITLTGVTCDGAMKSVQIRFADETTCLASSSYTAPALPTCSLTINSSTPDATCTGGTYDVDFALTWTDAPTMGDFEVSVDGGMNFTTVARTDFGASSSETITLTGVTCDGAMKSVQIRFADEITCLATSSYMAPILPLCPDIAAIMPAETTICTGTYTFPPIMGTDLDGNEAYYSLPNGNGTRYLPGDMVTITSTDTFYAYASEDTLIRNTPGLTLWLDGTDINANGSAPMDGVDVETWTDKSSNGNDATSIDAARNPAYDAATQSLQFAGTDVLTGTAGLHTNTLFIVFEPDATITDASSSVSLISSDNIQQSVTLGSITSDFGGEVVTLLNNSTSRDAISSSNLASITPACHILGIRADGTNDAELYFDGTMNLQDLTSGNNNLLTNLEYALGTDSDGTRYFPGKIKEVISYDNTLALNDFLAIQDLLNRKWGGGMICKDEESFRIVVPELDLTPSITCANETDFTVTVTVDWTEVDFANEDIEVTMGGQTMTIDPMAADGTEDVMFTFDAPAFGVELSAALTMDMDCASATTSVDLIACGMACTDQLGGNVFNDFDNDGTDDGAAEEGQPNILVYIYECDNDVPVDSTYTNANGDWNVDATGLMFPVRVEFSTPLTPWLDASTQGADNGTDVQFVDAASCEVDFGVLEPDNYCQTNPFLAVPCYEVGTASGSGAALVRFDYNFSGKNTIANFGQIGATWGTSYQRSSNTIFTSAFLKRNSGLAESLGHVFLSTPTTNGFVGSFDLTGVNGIDLGSVDRSSGPDFILSSSGGFNRDLDAFAKVYQEGFGDMDIYEDETLFLVNMFSKSLISVDISDISQVPTDASVISGTLVNEYPMNLPTCGGGEARPFALKIHDGKGYIGVVCDASISKNRFDLKAIIYEFDPINPATGLVEVLSFDLDYAREGDAYFGVSGFPQYWQPWYNDWNDFDIGMSGGSFRPRDHAPVVADIEFTEDGSMILGLGDRVGDQIGFDDPIPVAGGSGTARVFTAGDLLKACYVDGVFVMEGTAGSCAVNDLNTNVGADPNLLENTDGFSGNGEFFYDEFYRRSDTGHGHAEIALGGVAVRLGSQQVVSVVYDPDDFNTQGIERYSTTSGGFVAQFNIVPEPGPFGKARGLGDVEAFCDPVSIQVGNYVWIDTDMDGVQDACEDPVSGLTVKLYDADGDLVGVDVTDMDGEYYFDITNVDSTGVNPDGTATTAFSGLKEGEKHFIVFMGDSYDDTNDQITVGSEMYELTTADSGAGMNPDQNDSDVAEMNVPNVGDMPVIMFVADSTDHTFDAGLIEVEPILGAIGNYVWLDENSDGLQDAGEPGIPNVKVILRDVSGDAIDSTLTASDGSYLFPELVSAMYFVDVDESTLPDTDGDAMTQDLTQTTIFTNVVDGSDVDTDDDDGDFGNKDHSANGDFGYKITLDPGEENLTADFGYNYNPTDDVNNPMGSPVGALGDRVWYDSDQDGVQDPEEAGVEGVTLKLIAASEVTIGMTTYNAGDQITTDITDANGFYLFDGLPAGAYNVMVADDANGTGSGGPLDGFEQTGDPDHFATSESDNPDDSVEDDNMTTKPVVLGPGDVFLNVDFGYDNDAVLGSIGDYVWLDFDADGSGPNANGATGTPADQGNGTMGDLERPIEGVTIALIKDTNGDGKWDEGEPIIASDVTDADGLYYFPGLPTGSDADYLVLVTDTDNVLDGLEPTYDGDNNGETMSTDNYPRSQMANMELGLSSVTDLGTTPVLNQDFGYTPEDQDTGEGLIGDYVWYDTNSDGVQDDDESGIEGVKVYLLDDMSNIIDSAFTDENGYYYFGGLPVDMDYQVIIADDNFDPQNPLEDLKNTYDPDDFTVNPNSEGGIVMITMSRPIDTIQDFGFVADDVNPIGSLGNKIFEDLNANGVRDAGEMGFNGVTIDLYRDLNGNGELDPGEPKIGSTVTANAMGDDGMYLFDNLPIDSFIVDVTDINGILAGYWHTDGNQDPQMTITDDTADDSEGSPIGDNSKTDAFSVGLTPTVLNNLNVDFGYYKDPAAVGNYVWEDTDEDGQQDAGEPGVEDVVVSMMITYPDGTMITLTDTTDADGFYEFPNLLIDEDYRIGAGTGANGEDPTGVDPSGTLTPKYVIKVDENQGALSTYEPTLIDETTGGITDEDDSDAFSGVVAIPEQGSEDTDLFKTDGTLATANDEEIEASYDFGVRLVPILGAIGNYVWLDEDSDGLQDAGEPGIPNVKVILRDVSGDAIDSTLTAPDGSYLFPELVSAMYFVDVDESTLPDTDGDAMTQDLTQTTIFTNVVDGSDVDTDNDDGDFGNKDHSANGDFGYKITLDPGEENLTADFGYNYNPTDDVNNPMGSPVGALGDRVWYDSDQDGVQDPEEAGVEGVTLKLIAASEVTIGMTTYNAGDQITTDITDANGFYLFDGLPAGAYNVMVADDANGTGSGGPLDGFEQTGDPDHFATSESDNPDDSVEDDNMTTKPVVLGPGDVFLNVDFGYDNDAVLGSIGDYVWLDADADGNGPNANGATGTPVNQGSGGEDDSAEQAIEGVTVVLIKDTNGDGKWDEGEPIIASDVTDADGLYYFPGLPTGSDADYLVLVTDTDNVLDGLEPTYDGDNNGETMSTDNYPRSQMANMELGLSSVTDLGTTPVLNQDFGYTPEDQDTGEGLIGDYVWYDTDSDGMQDPEESGIEGVVMELYDLGADEMIGGGDDVLLATATTDENGYYYFPNLPVDESYQVKVAESTGASGEDNFAMGAVLEGLVNTFDPNDMTTNPDDMGGVVSLTTADPIDLDQDFGYVGDPNEDLGSIGNKVFNDVNANGVRDAGEMGFNGVTIDLYRDLNGNGELDPGEPKIGSTVTANAMGDDGMYLFENLPLDSFIVDVTDVNGILAGYWHTDGSQDPTSNTMGVTADDASGGATGDNSKTDAFSVGIDESVRNNLNVDFGYYKDPAAVGNYVWNDINGNGLQDDGETGLNGVEVSMMVTYPDATMITLTTTTVNDASGNPGFYEFPNLLIDEDYRIGIGEDADMMTPEGTGINGADPASLDPSGTLTPKYVIKVDENQTVFTNANLIPTIIDATGGTMDKDDSDAFTGVAAIPVQGNENTAAQDPVNGESVVASYDFGARARLDLATNIMISSMTPPQGYYDEDDPVQFMVNLFNQGGMPVSDVTITNYLPSELENAALVANSLTINGMPAPVEVTIMKVGNDYIIDFGTSPSDWFKAMDQLSFKFTADITDGTTPGTEITNTVEISSYDTDNNAGTTPPDDEDSVADNNNGGDGETMGTGLNDDETDEDALNNTSEDSDDHDIAVVPTGQVLPVELLGFTAKADKDHIDLVWSTASELNNSYFELERSEDGKVFKQITRLEGQGTTLEKVDYDYEDQEVVPGVLYYYRLKQVDFDGVFEYSEIRTAKIEAIDGGMELYPNPIGEATELQVRFYTTELTKEFVIMDIHSRSVLQVKQDLKNTGWNTMSIDIQILPAGTYLILDKEGNSLRFVKARE